MIRQEKGGEKGYDVDRFDAPEIWVPPMSLLGFLEILHLASQIYDR